MTNEDSASMLAEDVESDHDGPPIPTEDDYDDSGYDAADDPASNPVDEQPHPGVSGGPSAFPVAPANIPDWVKEFGNGRISPDRMIKVAPIGEGFLVPEAAAAWRSLQNAAQAAGWNLTMTGAYRTFDRQHQLFMSRFEPTDNGGKSKTYNGQQYWLKRGMAMAATPGTSNHGWGCAVDMALGGYGGAARSVAGDPAFMQWVVENAQFHGWSWEVQSEPWHLRLVGLVAPPPSDDTTGATDTDSAGTQPTIAPPRPTLRVGSKGGQVALLQMICRAAHWGDLKGTDGDFGPKTEAAVKAMQSFFQLKADGVYGQKSADALGVLFAGHQ